MDPTAYPWYSLASGEHLEQGDVLEACTVFLPPDELIRGESSFGAFEAFENSNFR